MEDYWVTREREVFKLWGVQGFAMSLEQGCRWWAMEPTEFPGIDQCGDCGIFIRADGRVVSPVTIIIMRKEQERGFQEGHGDLQERSRTQVGSDPVNP